MIVGLYGIHVCAYINKLHSRALGHLIHVAFYLIKRGADTFQRVRDRILGRLQDDSVVIGGDNKRSCTGLRRASRRWHGGTRRPLPAVHQNQHQADTIAPFCSKPFNAVLDCADPALVLLQIREKQIRCVQFINCVYNIHKYAEPDGSV